MRAIGPAGVPLTTGTLRNCLERGEKSGAFVEDLLRAIPPGPNEVTGSVVAEFLRGGTPTVIGYALVAIAGLWGERAKPLLLGALPNADGSIVTAAVTGLRVLRAIDQHVLRRLDPIVCGSVTAPDELRVAAAVAIGESVPDARAEAAGLAVRAWNPARSSSMWGSSRPPPTPSPVFLVALARSLLALGVPNASAMIQERAATSPDPLRRQLASLLQSRESGRHG
jgi:serine/threonine-protein kinase